jgi:hypothetical protein
MRILKRLDWLSILTGILTLIIVAAACLPCEISGENTMGGCNKCNGQQYKLCTSLEGKQCQQGRSKCVGYNVNKICADRNLGISSCSDDQYNCANEEDEACTWAN